MRTPIAALSAATATATLAAALTVGVAGAAHAERYAVDDARDTSHGSDILDLTVRNRADDLVLTTTHEDLRRNPASGSGGAFFIDTDKSDRGPEYVFVGGYFEGTDYQLLHTDGFGRDSWGRPVQHGDYLMKVDYAGDTVTVRISQGALREPDAVRVAARASGTRRDASSRGMVDWVGRPRTFTPWVDRG